MSRLASMLLFVAIAMAITGLVHYYIWGRLVRDPKLPETAHRLLTGLVVVLFLVIPSTFYLSRVLPPDSGRGLLLVLYCWFGLMFYLLILVGLSDLGRLIAHLVARFWSESPPADPERRTALARIIAGAVALAGGGIGAAAVIGGLASLRVREVRVKLSRLPKALSGTTIVQLTDLHLGPTLRREFLEEVVRRTNALEPDIIAITGDLVDGAATCLQKLVEPLRDLKARQGIYFVTGNHEYFSGVEEWCRMLTEMGIRVLRNERVSIGDEQASFDLAGIDDPQGRRFADGHGPDLSKALAGRDPKRELVLLAHQPRAVYEAEPLGVGLLLAGHTHGGQLWPWSYLVRLQQPVVSGLERIGRTLVFVSNGAGYWGPPMRLAIPAEIAKIVLSSE